MRKIIIQLYKFSELSPEAQDNAIDKLSDINVDHNWYEYIYDDAERIGMKITAFDLGYRQSLDCKFLKDKQTIAQMILKEHGQDCDTYLLAKTFLSSFRALEEKEDEELDDKLEELGREFNEDLKKEYLHMLHTAYEYYTSKEAIVESIEANEYEFTVAGKLF